MSDREADSETGVSTAEAKVLVDPLGEQRQRLSERLREVRARRNQRQRLRRLIVVLGLIAGAGSLAVWIITGENVILAGVAGGIAYVAMASVMTTEYYESEIGELENQLSLLGILVSPGEQRAERLYRSQQYQLERYYSLTLRHSAWIFVVGIACIAIGFVVVGAALYFVYHNDDSQTSEQIVLAALGGIAGLLSNFIALIYLRMYSETVKSVGQFHHRLVATHDVHFGNLLVSQLANADLREGTLAEMALHLARRPHGESSLVTNDTRS
jgi:hypothetical protein